MTHPTPFTFLGFYLNSLVDSGKVETLSDIKRRLENNTLFEYLDGKYNDSFDISLFSKKQLIEIEDYFAMMANAIDEDRKMGITENGLCLLVAYCFQAAQTKQKDLHPPMKELYGQ
ncbi:hypothetical protein AM493_02555 [Flavobacterium akiainvivens]|uniref:Uncharacterized protein n=1 Tax=Flavobacterium akiainvivens TaxID=1202724 RepID=A0A0M8MGE1_9FLAO|nr:hypothetical protein [Flavobacterium akiainvivens]KOS05038.1 hypothetical protein AM493_02555 [Flavobacterium akiainvivens]SFQ39866.1 hypothetical protein SAMN05444144_1047 [Flavobacterium akiainvivens]